MHYNQILEKIKSKGIIFNEIPYNLNALTYDKVEKKELLHLDIISDFLNPYGKHQMGYIFMQEFFNLIELKEECNHIFQYEIIRKQEFDNQNRPDILIVWNENKEKHAILIEINLDNTKDYKRSLQDYTNLKNDEYIIRKVVHILFNSAEIDKYADNELKIKILSVHKLIEWLENSKKKVNKGEENPINKNIVFYINLLEYENKIDLNQHAAEKSLSLNDDELRALLNNNKFIYSDIIKARQKEIIQLIKCNEIYDDRLNIIERQKPETAVELYYNYLRIRIEIRIYEDGYILNLCGIKPKGIGANCKSFKRYIKYHFKDYYKIREEDDDRFYYSYKNKFQFPSKKEFNSLMGVLSNTLLKMNKLALITESY